MTTELAVANTISTQIGRRAFLMMGTKGQVGTDNALTFDIHGCPKFSKVRVTLELNDTYKVEFFKHRKFEQVAYLERTGVYAEQLNQCIEHNTGLCLSL